MHFRSWHCTLRSKSSRDPAVHNVNEVTKYRRSGHIQNLPHCIWRQQVSGWLLLIRVSQTSTFKLSNYVFSKKEICKYFKTSEQAKISRFLCQITVYVNRLPTLENAETDQSKAKKKNAKWSICFLSERVTATDRVNDFSARPGSKARGNVSVFVNAVKLKPTLLETT